MQNDFIDMALGTPEAVAIVPNVKEKIRKYVENGDEIIFTKPDACILSQPKQPRWFYMPNDGTMNWMHNFVSIAPLLEK